MNETQLIQLFANAASSHTAFVWFDSGSSSFLFDSKRNLQYPAFFLQSTGASAGDGSITYSYTAYALTIPNVAANANHLAFEWDQGRSQARVDMLTGLTDVVSFVRLNNRQTMTFEIGDYVQDFDALEGAVGYRVDFSITMDFVKSNANFPSNN